MPKNSKKPTVINFAPTWEQMEALDYLMDDVTAEVMFGGAAGGGKSYLGCVWLIMMCKKYPGSRWLMGRSKLSLLTQTTLNTFFMVCRDFKLSADVEFKYNAQSHIITFVNGSEILLKDLFFYPSDPQFDSLGSLEIAGAFLDEVAQITHKAREVVKSRLGWKMPDGTEIKPKMFMSCNPNKGFAYKDFYLPWKDGTLDNRRRFIPALPDSNKYLSRGRRESLENLTGVERKRLLLGEWEWLNDPAAMIEYDSIMNLFTNDHIVNRDTQGNARGTKRADDSVYMDKAISVDVARLGDDNTVILVWDGLNIVDHRVLSKVTTDGTARIVKELQSQYSIPMSMVIVDADGVGGGVVDQLKGCTSFNNGSTPLNRENYSNLKAQCYYKLADAINKNEVYFECDDDVRMRVVEELEQVKRKDVDKDGKLSIIGKEQVKAVLRRSPDFSDAMMLRMWFIIKKKNQDFAASYSFGGF